MVSRLATAHEMSELLPRDNLFPVIIVFVYLVRRFVDLFIFFSIFRRFLALYRRSHMGLKECVDISIGVSQFPKYDRRCIQCLILVGWTFIRKHKTCPTDRMFNFKSSQTVRGSI